MITDRERHYMYLAIEQSLKGIEAKEGGPFGCIIVKGNEVVGSGHNRVLATNDPTAHAEVVAIRLACIHLGSFQLDGCEVYCSCEPCPMCFGALYWARPEKIFFANTRHDAAAIGFDDDFIYRQLEQKDPGLQKIPMVRVEMAEAMHVFNYWKNLPDTGLY